MLPDAVREYLETHRQGLLGRFFELLRIPSVANDTSRPDQCARAAEWVRRHAESIGLEAQVVPTRGRPAVLAEGRAVEAGRPTLLVYCHYDVQPPDPLEQWHSPPFEPEVRNGDLYARGASDNKGPLMAFLYAAEAWQRTAGLPVGLKLFVEGEEEVGSPNIEPFLAEHGQRLRADAAIVADTSFFAPDIPSITYGLRGLAYLELTVAGPRRDLHSGVYGGVVANPLNGLARLLAAMHDDDGRVTIDGFYDDVLDITDDERRRWASLPLDEAAWREQLGLEALGGGERGYSVLERAWARPTLDCNGIVGGYTGAGSKTIIPAEASAKVSMRLVPRQEPRRIVAAFREFVAAHTPAGLRAAVKVNATARPVIVARDSAAMTAARAALREAFIDAGRTPAARDVAMIRCGASVPVTEVLQRVLGMEPVLLGCSRPDDNIHSPNEKYALEMLWGTAEAAAAMMGHLARPALARAPG